MLIHRCPWCGKKVLFFPRENNKIQLLNRRLNGEKIEEEGGSQHFCPVCHRDCSPVTQKDWRTVVIIALAIISVFLYASRCYLAEGILLVLVAVGISSMPYEKTFHTYAGRENGMLVQIRWKPFPAGGILPPEYRIAEYDVLRVRWRDLKGNRTEGPWCIQLKNLEWQSDGSCICEAVPVKRTDRETYALTRRFQILIWGHATADGEILPHA